MPVLPQGNMDEDKKTWQWTKEFLQMIGPESLGRGMEGSGWNAFSDDPGISRLNLPGVSIILAGLPPIFLQIKYDNIIWLWLKKGHRKQPT